MSFVFRLSFSRTAKNRKSALNAEEKLIGQATNVAKTKYMGGRGSKDDNLHLPLSIIVDDGELGVVNEFMYLRPDNR